MRVKKRVLKSRIPKQMDKTTAERTKLFLLLFKLCGLFANVITNGRVKRCSWPTYGICIFWIGLVIINLYYMFNYLSTLKYIPVKVTIYSAKQLIGYISLSVSILTTYFSQDHFSKLFDRLDGYDYKAAQIKNKRRDNLWIPWIVTFLITIICSFLVNLIIYTKMVGHDFLSLLSDIYIIIIHMYSVLEKFLLLYLILLRFKHLNKNIVPNISWNEREYKLNVIHISDVKIMHLLLYQAHEAFNDIYRNPLLLSFISLMMGIVSHLSIFREQSIWISSVLISSPIMLIFILCSICHYTTKEANNTACVLSKGMTALINSGNTMLKIHTLTYFLQNRVSFDAAGFFTIDLPLFQSIVSALTTYFIILL